MAEKYTKQWRSEISDAQDYVGLNIEDIQKINQQWEQVSRLVDEGDVDNKALIDTAKQALTMDQDASLRSLLEEANNIPYEEMVEMTALYEGKVGYLSRRVEEAKHQYDEREIRLLEQRELLESIAPTAKVALDSVARQEIEKLKRAKTNSLEAELLMAQGELDDVIELFEKTGQAWPLPKLADVHYEPSEGEVFTVDQFPHEREKVGECIAKKVERMHESRLSDASTYLALLLKEKPGHIWTASELGESIYEDNDDPQRNDKRVGALISNHRRGAVTIMAEEFGDLVLQRGKRQVFDAQTSKLVKHSTRVVWRLVDVETAQSSQMVTTMNPERTLRQTYSQWEDIQSTASSFGSTAIDGAVTSESVSEEAVEPEQAEPTEDDTETEAKLDWRDEFTAKVHKTVEELKEQDMMGRAMTWYEINLHAKSRKAGTKTARERAATAKIVGKSHVSDDFELKPSQVIMTTMLNANWDIFRIPSRRREAAAIIDEIVEGYLRSHPQE